MLRGSPGPSIKSSGIPRVKPFPGFPIKRWGRAMKRDNGGRTEAIKALVVLAKASFEGDSWEVFEVSKSEQGPARNHRHAKKQNQRGDKRLILWLFAFPGAR